MPLLVYKCECGNVHKRFHRDPKDVPSTSTCPKCGKESKKQLSSPASRSIIKVDNGINARSVEVNLELVEDIQNRSTKDFKDK